MDTNLGAVLETPASEIKTRPKLAHWLGKLTNICIYLSVALIPLFFTPATLDVLELNKQTLLVILTGIALLTWIGQAISERKFSLSRSWLHLVVVVFLASYLAASFFSLDRYLSFVGNYGQMQWAFLSLVAFVVFYFIVVNTTRTTTKLYNLVLAFLASSTIVGILGFLQLVGIYPFGWMGEFTRSSVFNTVGTINSLGVYMTLPLIMAVSLTVLGCKDKECVLGQLNKRSRLAKILVWISLLVGLLVAVVVDYWVVWATILFGTALLVIIPSIRTRRIERSIKIIIPAALVVLSVLLLIFRTPINLNLPSEVAPSSSTSWNIAKQTLQEKPLFGSGPGTWIYDYAKYRPASINLSRFWTVRFERGLSNFLTSLATLGLVGVAFWLVLIISAVAKSASYLILEKNDDAWQAYLTVFTGWVSIVFISLFYNYNFTHHFAFWLLLALLASLLAKGRLVWDAKKSVVNSSALSLVFIFLCAIGVSTLWLSGQRLVADAKYSQAVNAFRQGQAIQKSIDSLVSAVTLNRWNDVYHRNLSQAYLVRAGQEMQAAPSAERAKKINDSITGSVDSAKLASEIVPTNVDNWSNFALILQSITSFTRGADERAIELYKEALKREPNNPVFYNEIGKLYLLRSDAYRQLLQADDTEVVKQANENIKSELENAFEALNTSIQLKQDYAPAHYNLGLVYERQGRLQDAIVKLEQVIGADSQNVGIGFQLAILYYRNNEKDKSLDVLEQIVILQPNYSNARWYLSALYEERGEYDKAIAQINKVSELNPGDQIVLQRLDFLIDLRDRRASPEPVGLLEPLEQEINGPTEQNEVRQ
ncbi:MAG: tetratricopeptide repeat protein [Patescibacteria group bacterium]|nr:tetratricopeptide repeat protein [Patescibacteria group bacterium]MBU2509273.1 tetratricopeptide repeat protein [Patescibacteria group bacterium]